MSEGVLDRVNQQHGLSLMAEYLLRSFPAQPPQREVLA